MKYLPGNFVPPNSNNGGQGDYQPPQTMDTSQARAMMAYQQQLIQTQMMEQQMQYEMAAMQQRMQMEAAHQQQLYQVQQQFLAQQQQQNHAAHFDANDVRSMMNKLKPGESFEVEMYQGFEVRHSKQRLNGAQLMVALILAAALIMMALLS